MSFIILIAFIVILTAIGIHSSKKSNNYQQFASSNTPVSWTIVMATLSASFLGGGYTMGVSTKAITVGIAALIGMFGFSLKEWIVARYIAPKIGQFKGALTLGDILSRSYGKVGQISAGVLGTVLCIGVLGVQVAALGHLFSTFFDLSYSQGVIISTAAIVIYSMMGGLSAIIWTDVLQFGILIVGIPLTLILALSMADISLVQERVVSQVLSLGSPTVLWQATALFLAFLLGETFVPPYIQRLLIGKSSEDTEKGTRMSAYISILFFTIAALIGIVADLLIPNLDPNTAMPALIALALPTALKGIVMIGVLSAIMSTADSFLHGGAVSLVHDVIRPIKEDLSDKTALTLLKATLIAMGLLSILTALQSSTLIDLCIYSWTIWSPIIVPPAFCVLIGRPFPLKITIVAATVSAGVTAVWSIVYADATLSALVVGVITHIVILLSAKNISAKNIEKS